MFDIQKACQFEYEMLGFSLPELAQRYDMPLTLLESVCTEQSWAPRISTSELTTPKDISDFTDKFIESARVRLNIAAIVRQIDNQSRVAQLEQQILIKMSEVVEQLSIDGGHSPGQLLSIVQALDKLQERNPLLLADQLATAMKSGVTNGSNGGVNVYIQNNIPVVVEDGNVA
jgi:hypothetical protein